MGVFAHTKSALELALVQITYLNLITIFGLSFEDKEVFIAHMVPSIGLWIQKSGTWKFDYCHTNTLFKYTYFPFIFP